MFRALTVLAAGIGFLGLVAASAPAQAAPVLLPPTLDTTASLVVGGFTFSWDGFDCTGPCSNTQVIANASGNGIELVPLAGNIVSAGGDLSVYIRIDSNTGAPINSYSVVTAGGAVVPPTVPGSTGVSIYTTAFVGISGTNTSTAAGSTSLMPISTSPPRSAVIAGIDVTGNQGSVTRVGISVTAVPEPGTLLMLATGLAGLAGLRRRRAS